MPDLILPSNTVRSKFTVKQLRDKVRSELGLLDTTFIRNSDVDGYMLEFQNTLAMEEEWFKFSNHFMTSGGVSFYDMPKDCITLAIVQYDIWRLPHITLEDLLIRFPLALTDTYKGPIPWYYTVDGANRILLFPTPTVASGVLTIYSALPPEPLGDDSLYYWPPYFDTVAIHYGCMRGSMKDLSKEGSRRMAVFTSAYEREYRKAADRLRNRAKEDTLIFGKRAGARYTDPLLSPYYPKSVPLP